MKKFLVIILAYNEAENAEYSIRSFGFIFYK